MPSQLHPSIPHVRQQLNPPQTNTTNLTQLHNSLLPHLHNFSPYLNPLVVQPPVFPPHHLVNSQFPVIPPNIAPQVFTLNKPQLNSVYSRPAHLLPCPTAPKLSLKRNRDLNLWCLPHITNPNANEVTNNASDFNNCQPTLPSSSAKPAISHAI